MKVPIILKFQDLFYTFYSLDKKTYNFISFYISDWIVKKIPGQIWPIFIILTRFGFFLQSRQYKNIRYASLFSLSSLFILPFAFLFGEF